MNVMRTYNAHFTGALVAECPACHRVCAGWDTDDLNDDGQLECSCDIGVCEMETNTWCCGNIDTLTETQVQPDPNSDRTEYRRVCSVCQEKYGEAERD